jgi:hypothetical protein
VRHSESRVLSVKLALLVCVRHSESRVLSVKLALLVSAACTRTRPHSHSHSLLNHVTSASWGPTLRNGRPHSRSSDTHRQMVSEPGLTRRCASHARCRRQQCTTCLCGSASRPPARQTLRVSCCAFVGIASDQAPTTGTGTRRRYGQVHLATS